ncbi:MAG: hypothetical protein HETSPECPRED_002814 [Heterodermia speciosa]|uniref:GST N-terminal domain-containing protein n=1 Tax=Heterodermia speciosa TaxID=116794 RepID=A0A8H3F622_9LECA|nr:MAG: hypothetical protein HETSPECPRED_002814 [Heterodermia speciosa]
MSTLILYDLPSKGRCACWSLNPWKTRLALNYKGIDYETKWLEYPDVAPTLKSFGLSPNSEGTHYTIPAVQLPDGIVMMDSRKIASELEHRYPSPSLRLDSPVLKKVEGLIPRLTAPLVGVFMPKVPNGLLNPPSAEYFERTRAERFGKTLSDLGTDSDEEKAWAQVESPLKEMGEILKAEGGPFALGKTVSYADFVIVSLLQYAKRVDEAIYERAVAIEPSLRTVFDASKQWLERDDR